MKHIADSEAKYPKVYDKYYNTTNTNPEFDLDNSIRLREIEIMGVLFSHEIMGFCHWKRIRLLKNGTEVYKIEVDGKVRQDNEIRNEYFFGIVCRQYYGDQFSFCEFCDFLIAHKRFPKTDELPLEKNIAQMYEEYAKRILSSKK